MQNDIVFEIIQCGEGIKFPRFIGTTEDELEACRQAALNGPAEINVVGPGFFSGTTIYSDDPDVYSGRYFAEAVRYERLLQARARGCV